MIFSREDTTPQKGFSDLLHYRSAIADGKMLLNTNAFLAGWEIAGPDMDSLPLHDSWSMCAQLSNALKLGSGWTIQTDQLREEYHEYPEPRQWMNPVSRLIDEERRQRFQFTGDYAPFVSRYFLSLVYQPAKPKKTEKWLFNGGMAADDLERFDSACAQVDGALRSQLGRFRNTFVRRLKRRKRGNEMFDDLARYVRYCVSGKDHAFRLPDYPQNLAELFSGDFTAGEFPRFNDQHIAVVAIDGFPESTFAGIMRAIEDLRFPFRYTQQGQCMDAIVATKMHDENRGFWEHAEHSISNFVKRRQKTSDTVDEFAVAMKHDARAARTEAAHGLEMYARYSAKVILMDRNPDQLDRKVDAVSNLVNQCGFQTRRETQNATSAWISSLPGHAQYERRIGSVTVTNIAHMAPLSAPYRGERFNPSQYMQPNTPPIFVASTIGGAPFNVHIHHDRAGAGNVIGIGPQGSGKTTVNNYFIANFQRLHPEAQVFAFDKDFTQYTLVKAMGGNYFDLAPGSKIRLCPLQDLITAEDMTHAAAYVNILCALNGVSLTPEMLNRVDLALRRMASGRGRSITHFQSLIESSCPQVASALQIYTMEASQSGGILDGEYDSLSISRLAAFEVGALYRIDPKVTAAVLFHLFWKIEQRLDPAIPTLLAVDELSNSLDQPIAVKALGDFLISTRKKNMAVMMWIQEIGKVLKSPLADTAIRECKTRIFLPNSAAISQEVPVYEKFECDEIDRAAIAAASPARDYYMVSPNGKRMISLGLDDAALVFLTKSGPADRALVDRLIERNPHGWQADFLRAYGLEQWAQYFESLVSQPAESMPLVAAAGRSFNRD